MKYRKRCCEENDMSYYKFDCKDCPDRYPACHDNCKRHKDTKMRRMAEQEELKKTNLIDVALRKIKFGRK